MAGRRPTSHRVLITPAVLLAIVAAGRAESPGAAVFQKLLADRGPAIVTVKFLLKLNATGDEETLEAETEVTGVVIDPKGMVLCSNTLLGGFATLLNRFASEFGAQITATPTDLKVLIGDDSEGKEAELVARDSELDLAWIQIKEPGDKPLAFVDLSKGAKPAIGEPVMAVRRMGKHFARTAVVAGGHIGGIAAKPRELYVPTGDVRSAVGLPVFTGEGEPLGVTIFQMPDTEDEGLNFATVITLLRNMDELIAGVILPASDVMKATQRARESAPAKPAPAEKP